MPATKNSNDKNGDTEEGAIEILPEEKARQLVKQGWLRVWMAFDIQATDPEFLDQVMEKFRKRLLTEDGLKVVSEELLDTEEVETTEYYKQQGIERAYSKVLEAELLFESLEKLVEIVLNYTPTTLEVIEPQKIEIDAGDLQHALVAVSDMIQRVYAAGRGGVVVRPV